MYEKIKLEMIEEVKGKGDFIPCRQTWEESFTIEEEMDTIILWYNDREGSTHILTREI